MAQSEFFCGPLYQKMSEDLQITGKRKRTHDGYLREIRKLADYCRRSPDEVSEAPMRTYFLYLKNVKHFAEGSLTVTLPERHAIEPETDSRHLYAGRHADSQRIIFSTHPGLTTTSRF